MMMTSESERNRAQVEMMHRLVDVLQRNVRVCYELDIAEIVHACVMSFSLLSLSFCSRSPPEPISRSLVSSPLLSPGVRARSVLPCLADRASQQCRANAYRLIRHSLVDAHSVARLGEQSLDWFVVRSLARDCNKCAVEREQVVKLVRAIVEIGSEKRVPSSYAAGGGAGGGGGVGGGGVGGVGAGKVPLSHAVMRAVIAVAESPEDPFKAICMETLAEICEFGLFHPRPMSTGFSLVRS